MVITGEESELAEIAILLKKARIKAMRLTSNSTLVDDIVKAELTAVTILELMNE